MGGGIFWVDGGGWIFFMGEWGWVRWVEVYLGYVGVWGNFLWMNRGELGRPLGLV